MVAGKYGADEHAATFDGDRRSYLEFVTGKKTTGERIEDLISESKMQE